MKREYSRRKFIHRSMMAGLALLGAGALLSRCNPKGGKTTGGEDSGADGAVSVSRCDDLSGLSPAELEKRKILGYIDVTPIPDSNCTNCQLYLAPKGGAVCGGCNLFKGPVFAGGYCTYWAAKPTPDNNAG